MQRKNPILDEAVQSFQRKIMRSIAGTACVVFGAAGVLAVPDILNASDLTGTFQSWQSEAVQKIESGLKLASDTVQRAPAPAKSAPVRTLDEQVAPAPSSSSSSPAPTVAPAPAPRRIVLTSVPMPKPVFVTNAAVPMDEIVTPTMDLLSPKFAVTQPLVGESIPTPDLTAKIDRTEKAPVDGPALSPQDLAAVIPDAIYPMPKAEPVPVPKPVEAAKAVEPPKPPTPAERLGLKGKDRAKAEKCLAQAVYFESRNEPVRGQIAVAQVVMNRVFLPYYPKDPCSVVFQNAHRLLGCQFTFACDGQPESIREHGAWSRAQRIAKQTLDAKVWLPEVAKATHYHATYVRPAWVREMKKMAKHGVHVFYRPWRWGDGSNEPGWGTATAAPKHTASLKKT